MSASAAPAPGTDASTNLPSGRRPAVFLQDYRSGHARFPHLYRTHPPAGTRSARRPRHAGGPALRPLHAPRSLGEEEEQGLRDRAARGEAEQNPEKVAAARVRAEQALKAMNAQLEGRIAERTVDLERKLGELSREIAQRQEVELTLRHSE